MNLLFVYGTLAHEEIQLEVIGRLCTKVTAYLDGCKVCHGRWPYLRAEKDSVASGWLMMDLSDAEIATIDEYEKETAVPGLIDNQIYARQQVEVRLEDKSTALCWVYFPLLEKWPLAWQESVAHG
jgi:gamma-glutamylcyclotransferase (GGCT)/AIG2-like uncharacterized protein YtfP